MNTINLPDPSTVDHLLASFDHHPFATVAVIVLAALAVCWRYVDKKKD